VQHVVSQLVKEGFDAGLPGARRWTETFIVNEETPRSLNTHFCHSIPIIGGVYQTKIVSCQ
jgi:hypothetical protein